MVGVKLVKVVLLISLLLMLLTITSCSDPNPKGCFLFNEVDHKCRIITQETAQERCEYWEEHNYDCTLEEHFKEGIACSEIAECNTFFNEIGNLFTEAELSNYEYSDILFRYEQQANLQDKLFYFMTLLLVLAMSILCYLYFVKIRRYKKMESLLDKLDFDQIITGLKKLDEKKSAKKKKRKKPAPKKKLKKKAK